MISTTTRHPLHLSVLESFAELCQTPDSKQASFTATLSRILTDAFILSDPDYHLPAFLTHAGVTIARFELDDREGQTAPGAHKTIGPMIGAWHDAFGDNPGGQTIVTSGRFALCAPFASLIDMLDHPTLMEGGMLGFFDPIYDDSLILVHLTRAARAEWHLRLVDSRTQAA